MATPSKRQLIIPKADQTNYDTYLIHESRVDVHAFRVYVGGDPLLAYSSATEVGIEPGVEHLMADRFMINMNRLADIDKERPILVHLLSCGGNWPEGMQMFTTILQSPNPVTVLAGKWARSMTSIIPLAADRFMLEPGAPYMIHRGTYQYSGTDHEAETDNEEREKVRALMYRIYSTRLHQQGIHKNKPYEEIEAIIDARLKNKVDAWFGGLEAKDWGFPDDIYRCKPETLRIEKKNEARREKWLELLIDGEIDLPTPKAAFRYRQKK